MNILTTQVIFVHKEKYVSLNHIIVLVEIGNREPFCEEGKFTTGRVPYGKKWRGHSQLRIGGWHVVPLSSLKKAKVSL